MCLSPVQGGISSLIMLSDVLLIIRDTCSGGCWIPWRALNFFHTQVVKQYEKTRR